MAWIVLLYSQVPQFAGTGTVRLGHPSLALRSADGPVTPSDDGHAQTEFLVCYDYGQRVVWAALFAPSLAARAARYPERSFVTERPSWMTDNEYRKLPGSHVEPRRTAI
jgi:hypothetical protein